MRYDMNQTQFLIKRGLERLSYLQGVLQGEWSKESDKEVIFQPVLNQIISLQNIGSTFQNTLISQTLTIEQWQQKVNELDKNIQQLLQKDSKKIVDEEKKTLTPDKKDSPTTVISTQSMINEGRGRARMLASKHKFQRMNKKRKSHEGREEKPLISKKDVKNRVEELIEKYISEGDITAEDEITNAKELIFLYDIDISFLELYEEALARAVNDEDEDTISFFIENSVSPFLAIKQAIQNDSRDMLETLEAEVDDYTIQLAAEGSHLSAVYYFLDKNFLFSHEIVLKEAIKKTDKKLIEVVCEVAEIESAYNIIDFLMDNNGRELCATVIDYFGVETILAEFQSRPDGGNPYYHQILDSIPDTDYFLSAFDDQLRIASDFLIYPKDNFNGIKQLKNIRVPLEKDEKLGEENRMALNLVGVKLSNSRSYFTRSPFHTFDIKTSDTYHRSTKNPLAKFFNPRAKKEMKAIYKPKPDIPESKAKTGDGNAAHMGLYEHPLDLLNKYGKRTGGVALLPKSISKLTATGTGKLYDQVLIYKNTICRYIAETKFSAKDSVQVGFYNNYPCIMVLISSKTKESKGSSLDAQKAWTNIVVSYFISLVNYQAQLSGLNIEITRRSSFGFLTPTIAPCGRSFRINVGIIPIEYAKVLVTSLQILNDTLSNLSLENLNRELPEPCFSKKEEYRKYFLSGKNSTLDKANRISKIDNVLELAWAKVEKEGKTTLQNLNRTKYAHHKLAEVAYRSMINSPDTSPGKYPASFLEMLRWGIGQIDVKTKVTAKHKAKTKAKIKRSLGMPDNQQQDIHFDPPDNIEYKAVEDQAFWSVIQSILETIQSYPWPEDIEPSVNEHFKRTVQALEKYISVQSVANLYFHLETLNELIYAIAAITCKESGDDFGSDSEVEGETEEDAQKIYGKKLIVKNGMRAILGSLHAGMGYCQQKRKGLQPKLCLRGAYFETASAVALFKNYAEITEAPTRANILIYDINACVADGKPGKTLTEEELKYVTVLILDNTSTVILEQHAWLQKFMHLQNAQILFFVSSGFKNEQIGADKNPYGTIRIFAKNRETIEFAMKAITDKVEVPIQSAIAHFYRKIMKRLNQVPRNIHIVKPEYREEKTESKEGTVATKSTTAFIGVTSSLTRSAPTLISSSDTMTTSIALSSTSLKTEETSTMVTADLLSSTDQTIVPPTDPISGIHDKPAEGKIESKSSEHPKGKIHYELGSLFAPYSQLFSPVSSHPHKKKKQDGLSLDSTTPQLLPGTASNTSVVSSSSSSSHSSSLLDTSSLTKKKESKQDLIVEFMDETRHEGLFNNIRQEIGLLPSQSIYHVVILKKKIFDETTQTQRPLQIRDILSKLPDIPPHYLQRTVKILLDYVTDTIKRLPEFADTVYLYTYFQVLEEAIVPLLQTQRLIQQHIKLPVIPLVPRWLALLKQQPEEIRCLTRNLKEEIIVPELQFASDGITPQRFVRPSPKLIVSSESKASRSPEFKDIKEEKNDTLSAPLSFEYIKESKEEAKQAYVTITFPPEMSLNPGREFAELKISGQTKDSITQSNMTWVDTGSTTPNVLRMKVSVANGNDCLRALMVHYKEKRYKMTVSDRSYVKLLIEMVDTLRQDAEAFKISQRAIMGGITFQSLLYDAKQTPDRPETVLQKKLRIALLAAETSMKNVFTLADGSALATDPIALSTQLSRIPDKFEFLIALQVKYRTAINQLEEARQNIPELLKEQIQVAAIKEACENFSIAITAIIPTLADETIGVLEQAFLNCLNRNFDQAELIAAFNREESVLVLPPDTLQPQVLVAAANAFEVYLKKNREQQAVQKHYLFVQNPPDFTVLVAQLLPTVTSDCNTQQKLNDRIKKVTTEQSSSEMLKPVDIDTWEQGFLHLQEILPGFVDQALKLPALGYPYPFIHVELDQFQKKYYQRAKDLLLKQLLIEATDEASVTAIREIAKSGCHLHHFHVQKLCELLGFTADITVWGQDNHLRPSDKSIALKLPKVHIQLDLEQKHFQFLFKRSDTAAEELINVTGDGNCGVYAVLGAMHAHILKHAEIYQTFLHNHPLGKEEKESSLFLSSSLLFLSGRNDVLPISKALPVSHSSVVSSITTLPNIPRQKSQTDQVEPTSQMAQVSPLSSQPPTDQESALVPTSSLTIGKSTPQSLPGKSIKSFSAAATPFTPHSLFSPSFRSKYKSDQNNHLSPQTFIDEWYALEDAICADNHDQLKQLLHGTSHDKFLKIRDIAGNTITHFAAEMGNVKVLEILIEKMGMDILDAKNSAGKTVRNLLHDLESYFDEKYSLKSSLKG